MMGQNAEEYTPAGGSSRRHGGRTRKRPRSPLFKEDEESEKPAEESK